jgi:hypothetical protein
VNAEKKARTKPIIRAKAPPGLKEWIGCGAGLIPPPP